MRMLTFAVQWQHGADVPVTHLSGTVRDMVNGHMVIRTAPRLADLAVLRGTYKMAWPVSDDRREEEA